jgi:hypothetical protein
MKQTIVEWLIIQLGKSGFDFSSHQGKIQQAKEMERRQQGYSEEEMKSAFKIGFNIGYGSPVQELDLKNEHCEKWFNQFKKK